MAALVTVLSLGAAVYVRCCLWSMRGDLDLVVDEETGRSSNVAFFRNPFKKIKP
jgi:hypothetical protein